MIVDGDPSHQPIGLDARFEHFVASASPGLLRSAYLLTGDRHQAEDLLQSALVRTLRRWPAISSSPVAYTFSVLVNLSRDGARTQRRRPRTAPEHELPERRAVDPVESLIERDAIVQAARRLPQTQREVLGCRFLMDLTVSDTAIALGIPEGTVKSYTARALARMRELLAEGPVPPISRSSEVESHAE
jgi:RNA polymerase sigma-70 factor (sigma-E family)